MPDKPYLIHFHFHQRRTGVTRSVENVLPGLKSYFNTFIFGYGIDGEKVSLVQLLKIFYDKMPCIIHVHRNPEALFALLLRIVGGKFKLIATRHSDTSPSWLTRWLLKQIDVVVALIPAQQLPVTPVVIGHGIDIDFFKPGEKKQIAGISQPHIISAIGRVRKTKGQLVFLKAIVPLLKVNPTWAAVIVGRVDKASFKQALDAVACPVRDQVFFIDETRDIKSIYQASDAVVVPSFSEGFSLVPLEAMACGCVVVATAHVGIHSSAIHHNENGFLFEKGNVAQLTTILKDVMDKKSLGISERARETVVSDWSVSRQVEQLKNLYLGKS